MTKWKFLGILFGVAIRTKKPLNLNLSSIIWKLLTGYNITFTDLACVDDMFAKNMKFIKELEKPDDFELLVPFDHWEVQAWNGDYIKLNFGGRQCSNNSAPLTFSLKDKFVEAAIQFKINELSLIIKQIQRGMSLIVPVPCIKMFKWKELELLVCGRQEISITSLKSIVRYRDCDESRPEIAWLWEIVSEMTNTEKELFLRFISGRSRLPKDSQDIGQRFQIMIVDRQTDSLPTAQTCFFQLRLGSYSSKEIMKKRMHYAMIHCRAIDADNYMLQRQAPLLM